MGLALTSGYSLDVNAPLPESDCLLSSSNSLCPLVPLLPHAWGPVEVIYLSMNRLLMMPRQEAPGPWH